jgi:CHAD domain-containing protein
MAYLIRRKLAPDTEVRRVLLEQNRRALSLLRAWQDNPRDNVHQARQAFKRIRAVLRLVKPCSRYVYRVENAFFRDLGRNLAYARDTEAVIEALGLLETRISGPLAQESLRMLQVGLEQRAARERDCGIHDLPGRVRSACDALAQADKRLRDLPIGNLRRRDFRRGVAHTLERCAAGFDLARHSESPEDFHAWRKQVKYAYHLTRLMQQIMPRWANKCGNALGTLAGVLGHYHDLVMLEALLRNQADELNVDVHLRSMQKAVRNAKAELAAEALVLGRQTVIVVGTGAEKVVSLASRA